VFQFFFSFRFSNMCGAEYLLIPPHSVFPCIIQSSHIQPITVYVKKKKLNETKNRHLHLHVISSDLTTEALKTKRHYNSFSPRVGFFVPLAEVRPWFENDNGDDAADHQLLVRGVVPLFNLIFLNFSLSPLSLVFD